MSIGILGVFLRTNQKRSSGVNSPINKTLYCDGKRCSVNYKLYTLNFFRTLRTNYYSGYSSKKRHSLLNIGCIITQPLSHPYKHSECKLTYFQNNENELLEWLIEQKTTDTIEHVTEEILEFLIEDEEFLAVFFSGPCEEDDPCDDILDDLVKGPFTNDFSQI